MNQYSYEAIISCIKFGAPAIANELIAALNNTVEIANKALEALEAKESKTVDTPTTPITTNIKR